MLPTQTFSPASSSLAAVNALSAERPVSQRKDLGKPVSLPIIRIDSGDEGGDGVLGISEGGKLCFFE